MTTIGIYCIKNLVNDKNYVGSSKNIEKRWKGHLSLLKKSKHPNNHLQSSFAKYGIDKFAFQIIEVVHDQANLIEREQYWLDTLKPYDHGYNNSKHAFTNKGRVVPIRDEHRANLSKAAKERYARMTPEERRASNAHAVGRVPSDKELQAISKSVKQKWVEGAFEDVSQKTKENWANGTFDNLADKMKEHWENGRFDKLADKVKENWKNGVYDNVSDKLSGRVLSEERRKEMSQAAKDAWKVEGNYENFSQILKERWAAGIYDHVAEINRNRVITDEQRTKQSIAIKNSWARRREEQLTNPRIVSNQERANRSKAAKEVWIRRKAGKTT